MPTKYSAQYIDDLFGGPAYQGAPIPVPTVRTNFERVNIEDKGKYGTYGGTVKATGNVNPLEWGKAAAEFARDMPGRSQIRVIFEDTQGNAFSTKFMHADSAEDMHETTVMHVSTLNKRNYDVTRFNTACSSADNAVL